MNLKSVLAICASAMLIVGCQSLYLSDVPKEERTHRVVKELDVMPAGDIYPLARQWFSEYFVSGESVIDYEDKASGVIIGNSWAYLREGKKQPSIEINTMPNKVKFLLKVEVKEGKMRVTTVITGFDELDTYSPGAIEYANQKLSSYASELQSYVLFNRKISNW